MSYDNKVPKEEIDQRTYEDSAEAKRVMTVDEDGDYVAGGGGGSGGTEYDEGDVEATFTGTMMLHEGAGDTAQTISSDNPLPINFSGSVGGVEVVKSLDFTAYDLNAAAFSETTNISTDFILDSIELNFSTAESKTITVTSTDGTIIYEDTNTNQSISLGDINIAFNGADNVTVAVTQFGSAGTMDCILKTKNATATLVGSPTAKDYFVEVGQGNISGVSHSNKFGRNPEVDTGSAPEDLWDGGGVYVPPTQARIHTVKSTSAEDAGTLVSGGTATGGSATTIIDTGATFSSDGVAIGDTFLNDTQDDHSVVLSVDSETQLTLRIMHHNGGNISGDSYRVVTSAGTGAVAVHITNALDSSWNTQKEFVILNGTSNVNTANSYLRINSVHIHGAGSNNTNVGNLTLTAAVDLTKTAQISVGMGRTLMAFTTIPAGKKAHIVKYYTSLNRAGAIRDAQMDLSLRIRLWGDYSDGEEVIHYLGAAVNGGIVEHDFKPYFVINEMTDLWIRIESVTDNDTDVSGGFDLILVDK